MKGMWKLFLVSSSDMRLLARPPDANEAPFVVILKQARSASLKNLDADIPLISWSKATTRAGARDDASWS
jgi:hypothetical protein